MKKRAILGFFILLVILIFFGCDLGGDSASIDSEEAKSLYLAASEALYDEVDPLGENSEKAISPKSISGGFTHKLPETSSNGVQLTGIVEGEINSTMPENITPDTQGNFTNTVKITMNLKGTMDEVEVPDPDDPTKTLTISGTIEHYMKMEMEMTMAMGTGNAITPGGTLDLEMQHTSIMKVVKNDGTIAKFELTFEDDPDPISLGGLGPGSPDQMPNGANAYQKTAKLKTYDENDKLITEADVSIMDVPWMMGNLMGGGGPGGPGGGGPGGSGGGGFGGGGGPNDPIDIPYSVDDVSAFDAKEEDFLIAINNERTTALTRDAGLDALARRYADVGKCDPMAENLIERIKLISGFVNCSDAAHFVAKSISTSIAVDTTIETWLMQAGATDVMQKATFTKIGIAVLKPSHIPEGDPGADECVIVLLVNPGS